MPREKCSNFDVCEIYGTYGLCDASEKEGFRLTVMDRCHPGMKNQIRILASIDAQMKELLKK